MTSRTISVGALARVEGEGGLEIVLRDGEVKSAALTIFEPPRFFEALMRGRAFTEAPDIAARICGICPVAYQMSAVHAMEDALGVRVTGPLRDLRRLLYCGEWIESHMLHVHMLHMPDFLGYAGGVDMARDHGDIVRRGLAIKKVGNEIMTLVGGREIHPINVRVGGFYRAPRKRDLRALAERLERALEQALQVARFVAGFDFPDCARDYVFVSLRHADEYPFNEGRIVSSRGLDIAARDFETHFEEFHVQRSTALHARMRHCDAPYLVGPLARYALNADVLSPLAKEAAREARLESVCVNPYRSIIVRAIETIFALDEALRIIARYEEPDASCIAIAPRAGVGHAATEAPRGMLYHRYRLEADGTIADAIITPPTSQNQAMIEEDLKRLTGAFVHLPEDELRHRCEQTVRNHDPCISCSTHFLRLEIDRG
ncbi:Ni/Fe hydrogenase subunit alpha [Methylosinus sp. C49]|uniref:Ni/Fe hydrogenase subunit alpha n=1 Tax=Methylosinus sp. C49 TaxID=2699395 RepID=UPI0013676357|nr:nickel-dependent hydrogenase large subunit [Methylosinus sp. C49]BBU62763.1 Ni/Fe hydrogenase subunit alpha [Methylosinus sp. C49]